jgi:hypothetical protein
MSAITVFNIWNASYKELHDYFSCCGTVIHLDLFRVTGQIIAVVYFAQDMHVEWTLFAQSDLYNIDWRIEPLSMETLFQIEQESRDYCLRLAKFDNMLDSIAHAIANGYKSAAPYAGNWSVFNRITSLCGSVESRNLALLAVRVLPKYSFLNSAHDVCRKVAQKSHFLIV